MKFEYILINHISQLLLFDGTSQWYEWGWGGWETSIDPFCGLGSGIWWSIAWPPDLLSSWLLQVCGPSGQEAVAVRCSREWSLPGVWQQWGLAHLAGHINHAAVAALLAAPLTNFSSAHHFWTDTCWTWRDKKLKKKIKTNFWHDYINLRLT